mmetsp:Transcript_88972/g.251091  ORF Transcript_88972/g.251091 Transcript_88972/m.251091 type:complete len:209 (+) Transcript_88972:135-761(+)
MHAVAALSATAVPAAGAAVSSAAVPAAGAVAEPATQPRAMDSPALAARAATRRRAQTGSLRVPLVPVTTPSCLAMTSHARRASVERRSLRRRLPFPTSCRSSLGRLGRMPQRSRRTQMTLSTRTSFGRKGSASKLSAQQRTTISSPTPSQALPTASHVWPAMRKQPWAVTCRRWDLQFSVAQHLCTAPRAPRSSLLPHFVLTQLAAPC